MTKVAENLDTGVVVGKNILESATELASNRMTGGSGADEFRCYGANDIVEDFDESEGDTMLGTCES
jgi:hypothetical protein